MSVKHDVANLLVSVGAVAVRPDPAEYFVYTSGMRSPIYCDNRLFISSVNERAELLQYFYSLIRSQAGTTWDLAAGVATAGIPFAAWIAMEFQKPLVYVRDSQKDHGKQRTIEGQILPSQTAIVIEDLITTGGSAVATANTLRARGLVCNICFAIFDYEFSRSKNLFHSSRIRYSTLTGFSALIDVIEAAGTLTTAEIESIKLWHEQQNSLPE